MDVKMCRSFSFIQNTTYGCGGVAEYAYFPKNIIEAEYVFDSLVSKDAKFTVLGNGSDVLAQDGIYKGYVIVTKALNKINVLPDGNIYCESGVTVSTLIKLCIENGLGGLEYLSGIPATVGGLCFMNGGAGGKYIGDNIVSICVYDGKSRNLTQKECNFTYKYSTMRDIKCVILGCTLKTERKPTQIVKDDCAYYLSRRKNLPKGKSCGCVFKNPAGQNAGALIEAAGLKGTSVGSATVSSRHANFIINNGTCSKDVYDLITLVKQKVKEKFATELEEEVCYIGDFK
ncbi:MAG: UDP-N-acetylmuramate dehydrogenase [Clostridia bacterium]|nr:UDP-N-acetylmuramate dehydrogenase [Clostridia bacterium]